MHLKACSFLPAATEMIHDMDLQEYLYGVTFECPSDKPKVVRSHIEGNQFSSVEIDNIVSQSKAQGKSLYYIDEDLLQTIEPDIIFTQDVCDVCQIDTAHVQRAIYKLKKKPLLVPLKPRTLQDVYDNALTIATSLGKEENAYHLLAQVKKRTDKIMDTLRAANAPLRRVALLEWLDPIYNCGHWIPYQAAQAGGVDMLSNPGGYSIKIDWETISRYDPEVLVIAPCGLSIDMALQEAHILTQKPGWESLTAVKNNNVFFANSNLFTCPSTKLINGIELLAGMFHPELFSKENTLHFLKLSQLYSHTI